MTRLPPADAAPLADGVIAGDRRALARAITLVESTRDDHRGQAEALLERLLPHAGRGIRLGVTGIPGVGKSTFIEALGLHLVGEGHRVAVLAVDPSSPRTGGSILGDKTRMERLARESRAFIRPSPAGGTLGGVARRSREALLVCEAAGFDVVIVETVGVGQSETAVAEMVDTFLLLLAPGGGDDLQGIKKGIVELADIILVNKADGDLAAAAGRARRDYQAALHLLRPADTGWTVPVLQCSAIAGTGIAELWEMVGRHRAIMEASGGFAARRAGQASRWMWGEVTAELTQRFRAHPRVVERLAAVEARVAAGAITPAAAAQNLLEAFLGGGSAAPGRFGTRRPG